MGTRTAVFQEQANGEFIGIYVHYDGYIEGVGKTLFEYYKDRNKVAELLSKKRFLSCLGTTTEMISFDKQMEMYQTNREDIQKYCVAHNEEEYFYSHSLEDIRNMQYLTYCKGEIDGFYENTIKGKVFKAFRGSDNNGYLYMQDRSGTWFVSYIVASGEMSEFKPLKLVLSKLKV